MTPTTKQIEAYVKKHGPKDMMEIATHFGCLMKPTPNSEIRSLVWNAVGEGKIRMKAPGFKFEAGPADLWP